MTATLAQAGGRTNRILRCHRYGEMALADYSRDKPSLCLAGNQVSSITMIDLPPFDTTHLPAGIRCRHVDNGNGLRMHLLEAGFEQAGRPCILLLHGFPELAYSWRKIMPPLAAAGYHVVAPDQRGYGRSFGWDAGFDGDLDSFRFLNLVRDLLGLIGALGYARVDAVIGHDFGSPVAGCCALIRPDVFRSVIMMSAPFAGPGDWLAATDPAQTGGQQAAVDMHAALAALNPPRKHYQWYYSTREADADMRNCPQGLHAFLRAYFHVKSADWPRNRPAPLQGWRADELARMPHYYIMPLGENMAEVVAADMPSAAQIEACEWLSEAEMAVYAEEFARNGFQGGLQWYRCATNGRNAKDLELFAGRRIEVPAGFVAGAADWGTYQRPGDLERMRDLLCTDYRGTRIVDGAGHWVQQEQPEEVCASLLRFLAGSRLD